MHSLNPRSLIQIGNVVEQRRLCAEHHLLSLRLPKFPDANPGQFVHLGVGSAGGDDPGSGASDTMMCGQGFEGPFLRRAFSIAQLTRTESEVVLSVLFRVVGTGTRWLSRLRPGQTLSVLGPLGVPFEPASASTRAILVAGGVGLPPVAWYGRKICEAGGRVAGLLGARSKDQIALFEGSLTEQKEKLQAVINGSITEALPTWWVATDDGSAGFPGTVAAALQDLLASSEAALSGWTVFTCGPDRMMHAVADLCRHSSIRCFVCLEREMACGTGTCQSCAVAVNDASAAEGWRFKLCCTDGPVFAAHDVRW